MLGAAALQKQFPLKKNLRLCFKKRYINIENDSHRELIAVERKGRNLNSDSLWDGNDNIQSLLSGFDIEEKLLKASSEEKVSITGEKDTPVFCGKRRDIDEQTITKKNNTTDPNLAFNLFLFKKSVFYGQKQLRKILFSNIY